MWTWYDSKIIKIVNETEKVKRFWLKVDYKPKTETDSPFFTFKPGQFITLDLPIHEKRLKRWRSYSIASLPSEDNIIELCIVLLEKGLGTTYLFNEATIGTNIKFKGAAGVFTLPEKIEEDLLFICTGTGLAPFRSMIQLLLKDGFQHKIDLVFGTRKITDILYAQELETLALKYPNFKYHLALSREADFKNLSLKNYSIIKNDYVHAIYPEIIAKNKNLKCFLCGWNVMLDEAQPKLLDCGLEKANIYVESYG